MYLPVPGITWSVKDSPEDPDLYYLKAFEGSVINLSPDWRRVKHLWSRNCFIQSTGFTLAASDVQERLKLEDRRYGLCVVLFGVQ